MKAQSTLARLTYKLANIISQTRKTGRDCQLPNPIWIEQTILSF